MGINIVCTGSFSISDCPRRLKSSHRPRPRHYRTLNSKGQLPATFRNGLKRMVTIGSIWQNWSPTRRIVTGDGNLKLKNRPVIFIHGNSDGALAQGDEEWSQGWSANIKYFLINGYSSAEMYAITYGNRNLTYAMNRSIDCATVIKMRLFLEAVLQYTGSQYVNIVAHSMGVTIARIIIQGNTFSEAGKVKCHLGKQLMNRVSNLIGIAGANFGMCSCSNETIAQTFAACGKLTGFWTSSRCPDHEMATNTRRCWHVLTENATEKKPDKLLKGEHLTSLIPLSDRSILCDGPSHFALKWATMDDQLAILRQQ
uniref:Lipase n=1 Tax=Globodera rostochiensis TaxID=31243 RepID=A0A914H3Q4_GLORO